MRKQAYLERVGTHPDLRISEITLASIIVNFLLWYHQNESHTACSILDSQFSLNNFVGTAIDIIMLEILIMFFNSASRDLELSFFGQNDLSPRRYV